jgi:hypothetical protein
MVSTPKPIPFSNLFYTGHSSATAEASTQLCESSLSPGVLTSAYILHHNLLEACQVDAFGR